MRTSLSDGEGCEEILDHALVMDERRSEGRVSGPDEEVLRKRKNRDRRTHVAGSPTTIGDTGI